jgi:uracil-DNA glycosylase
MTVELSLDCLLCPRLVAFRQDNRRQFPDWHNAPVPSLGDVDARLLIVGLAPGLRGANRTGLPFTGDDAGVLFHETPLPQGFAKGSSQDLPQPHAARARAEAGGLRPLPQPSLPPTTTPIQAC